MKPFNSFVRYEPAKEKVTNLHVNERVMKYFCCESTLTQQFADNSKLHWAPYCAKLLFILQVIHKKKHISCY